MFCLFRHRAASTIWASMRVYLVGAREVHANPANPSAVRCGGRRCADVESARNARTRHPTRGRPPQLFSSIILPAAIILFHLSSPCNFSFSFFHLSTIFLLHFFFISNYSLAFFSPLQLFSTELSIADAFPLKNGFQNPLAVANSDLQKVAVR